MDDRNIFLSNDILVFFMDDWLDMLMNMFLFYHRLMMFMEHVLMMLTKDILFVLNVDILMMLMNHILMELLDNRFLDMGLQFRSHLVFLNCLAFVFLFELRLIFMSDDDRFFTNLFYDDLVCISNAWFGRFIMSLLHDFFGTYISSRPKISLEIVLAEELRIVHVLIL